MTNEFIEIFEASFDNSRFPNDFLQQHELLECFSHNDMVETLFVKDKRTNNYYVSKCYTGKSLYAHTTESELLKKLNHEGIPTYIGEYKNEEMLCVVREFIQGKSLDKQAEEIPLTKQQSISIILQLCEILIYLHGQTPPIIHRDIKPQNIIINDREKISLIDFGISRYYNQTAQVDTFCCGTKYYAAPEQYGFSQTDCRSDIFSLGVLLCWMLTGDVNVQQAIKTIPDPHLVKIISKCTAFSPKGRYANAIQVRDALTGRITRRKMLTIIGTSIILLGASLGFSNSTKLILPQLGRITFQEPLIEYAVRLALQKEENEKLSEQDLLSITELYVFGDKAATNEVDFNSYVESFVNNDGTVLRGDISSLNDLRKLKNLRRISLAYQNITDLSPLSELSNLEYLDLRHNPIDDVTPLSKNVSLTSLILFDTNVSDLTELKDCFRLTTVDVGYTKIKSTAALSGLTFLRVLVIRKAPLESLAQIETFTMIEKLYLSETLLRDLSPLLELPRLQQIEVSENMRPAVEAISESAHFKIIFQ